MLYLQTYVEARALPRDVDDFVAVNLFAETLLIDRCGDCYDCVRVQVVNMLVRNERVKRRINRTSARVKAIDTVAIHWIHRIFNRRFRSALRAAEIDRLHSPNLIQIE